MKSKLKNKFFILRHGQSLRNVKKVAACWPEKFYSPLTKEGREQVKTSAQKLKKEKIDLIFSSDLLRTKQTAEIVGKELKLKPKFDKRLREVDVGVFNGRPIEEAGRFWDKEGKLTPLEYYSQRYKIAPPKGETYSDIEKRMASFIKETDKKYQGKNILIVGHERPLTLLEKAVKSYNLKKFVKILTEDQAIKTGEVRRLK
ncbi:MAG: histidine phosphatase family protein [bacterium]